MEALSRGEGREEEEEENGNEGSEGMKRVAIMVIIMTIMTTTTMMMVVMMVMNKGEEGGEEEGRRRRGGGKDPVWRSVCLSSLSGGLGFRYRGSKLVSSQTNPRLSEHLKPGKPHPPISSPSIP